MDCVPYVNLKPFKKCQSDYYQIVMDNLAYEARKQYVKYETSNPRYQELYDKWQNYTRYANYGMEQKNNPREARSYPCVLELIDTWFNADDKTKMTNYLEILAEVKAEQVKANEKIREKANAMRSEISEYYYDKWLDRNKPDKNSSSVQDILDKYNLSANGSESNSTSINEVLEKRDHTAAGQLYTDIYLNVNSDSNTEEKTEQEENYEKVRDMLSSIDSFLDDLDLWTQTKEKTYEVFEENQTYIDDITVIKESIAMKKRAAQQVYGAIESVSGNAEKCGMTEKYQEIKQEFQDICKELNSLFSKTIELEQKVEEKAAITMQSYLVCRCGGIIKIITDGQWVKISKERIKQNIIDLMKYAEGYLYDEIKVTTFKETKFSLIDAYNLIHMFILDSSETTLLSDRDYIINAENEEHRNDAPGMKITITPAKDVLNKEHKGKAGASASTLTPYVGPVFAVFLALGVFVDEDSSEEDTAAAALVVAEIGLDNSSRLIMKGSRIIEAIKIGSRFVAKTLNYLNTIVTCLDIYKNLDYESHADFTGEIKIDIYTFAYQYIFKGNYDINGELNGIYTQSKKKITKTPFLLDSTIKNNELIVSYKIFDDGYQEETQKVR